MGGADQALPPLRERLAARLGDPTVELPEGFLTQLELVGAMTGDRDGDELLLGALRRRQAGAEAAARELPRTELIEVLDVRATLEQRLDQDDAARETLGRLLALAPSDALRWRVVMFDLVRQRWESAAGILAAMVREPSAPDTLRYFYVNCLAHLGRYDEMLKQLDLLAPPVPAAAPEAGEQVERAGSDGLATGFVSLLVDAAWALRDAGRDGEAAALFRRALVYQPHDEEAQAALLYLYGTAEERAAAATAAAARRQAESDPVKLFEEGSDLLGAGDAAGALALLARAAPELGGTAYAEAAWYNLGNAAWKLERWEEAARAYQQASAVNASRVDSHYRRGVALFHLSRCQEAVAVLKHVLELQPDKRDAHHYLAGCYTSLGDAAAAARETAIFNQPH
jgi:tetratricopeptide (TPR) repeat protein